MIIHVNFTVIAITLPKKNGGITFVLPFADVPPELHTDLTTTLY
jgi:hypothetical protein